MTDASTTGPERHGTVDVPDATLAYSVLGNLSDATADSPPLMLCGSPMDSTVAIHETL